MSKNCAFLPCTFVKKRQFRPIIASNDVKTGAISARSTIMSTERGIMKSNDAAEAFYGQSEDAFAEQIKMLGASDPRLIRAFERTRQRYLQQKQN